MSALSNIFLFARTAWLQSGYLTSTGADWHPWQYPLKPWEPVFDLRSCVCLKGGRISDKGVSTRWTTERLMERRATQVRFIYVAEVEDKLNE